MWLEEKVVLAIPLSGVTVTGSRLPNSAPDNMENVISPKLQSMTVFPFTSFIIAVSSVVSVVPPVVSVSKIV